MVYTATSPLSSRLLPPTPSASHPTPFPHSPDAVEDAAVGVDADVQVGQNDVMEVSLLLVLEEEVRHPHHLRLGQGQVLDAT